MSKKKFPWLQSDWPIEKKQAICHLFAEDIRRQIAIATQLNHGRPEGTEYGPRDASHPARYAIAFEDWMQSYDYAIQSGVWTVKSVQEPNFSTYPGRAIVWFEDNFSSTISDVEFSEDEKGEFVISGCSPITKDCIYDSNTAPTLTPVSKTWYIEDDNWRKGTPFVITDCDNPLNNGFYRVYSKRLDGSTLYVKACDKDGNQVQLSACSSGTMVCNFGGDWWTLRGMQGNVLATHMNYEDSNDPEGLFSVLDDYKYVGASRGRWWTDKDMYHRYEDHVRGPLDGRPPSGGQLAIDFNNDWVRTVNDSLYHTYDNNSHRYVIKADSTKDLTYTLNFAIFEAKDYLPEQVDPKEQVPPYYGRNTKSIRWKYGSKVPIKAKQITNPAKLGAINPVDFDGFKGESWVGVGNDRQYIRSGIYQISSAGALAVRYGIIPPLKNNSNQSPVEWWEDTKYDPAIQNMVELACEAEGWCMEVDNDYKENWFKMKHPSWGNETLDSNLELWLYGDVTSRTYQYAYSDLGIGAYKPEYDVSMPKYALLNDELWGENSSAFELILKKLGSSYYDWYYDDVTPYMSESILKVKGKFYAETNFATWTFPVTINGKTFNNQGEAKAKVGGVADAIWPRPVGTWRRTWKYSLGYVREDKMRGGDLTDPDCHDYGDYSWYDYDADPQQQPCFMPGHHRMTAPDAGQFEGDDLETNHGPDWKINNTDVYLNRVYLILNHCRKVLDSLEYRGIGLDDIGVVIKSFYANGNSPEKYNSKAAAIAGSAAYLAADIARLKTENGIDLADPTTWNAAALGIGGVGYNGSCAQAIRTVPPYDPYWYCATTFAQSALIFTSGLFYDKNVIELLLLMRVIRNLQENYVYSPCTLQISGLRNPISINIPGPDSTYYNLGEARYYLYLPVYLESNTTKIVRFSEAHDIHNYVFENYFNDGGYENLEIYINNANIGIQGPLNQGQLSSWIIKFHWDRFSDEIWKRTYERADYRIIDPFGIDTRPPLVNNEFFEKPVLYDSNFPGGYIDYPFFDEPGFYDDPLRTWSNYVPIYKIRCESVYMEDLEGLENEVEYIFDFEGGDLSDKMDVQLFTRYYDWTLDMDVGDVAGGFEDSWAAYDDDIGSWTVTVNSKDNAESRGSPADNYGIPSDPENIDLGVLPMFPLKPRIQTQKVKLNDVWFDHVWSDAPLCKNQVEYKLLRWHIEWSLLYNYGASHITPQGGIDSPNHFYIGGATVTENSPMIYQMQFRNKTTKKVGLISEITNNIPAIYTLTLENPEDLDDISINGTPITTFPHAQDCYSGQEISILCEDDDFGYWITPDGDEEDNPLAFGITGHTTITVKKPKVPATITVENNGYTNIYVDDEEITSFPHIINTYVGAKIKFYCGDPGFYYSWHVVFEDSSWDVFYNNNQYEVVQDGRVFPYF